MTESAATGHSVLYQRRKTLLEVLRHVTTSGQPWTLLDYPLHLNCGDGALYLGALEAARSLDAPVIEVLDRTSYRTEYVKNGNCLFVHQAGGNWGGLYPTHHQMRISVLEATKRGRLIQLPQSIHYASPAHRDELRRAVDAHGDFTLLVRDQRSYDIARADYQCEVHLVPDMAFALGPQQRAASTTRLQVQGRTDKEAGSGAAGFALEHHTEPDDWLVSDSTRTKALLKLTVQANRLQGKVHSRLSVALAARADARLAAENFRRAVEFLSRGDVLVTDRLHGHILATLLDVPHVAVNDKFGKVSALRGSWTHTLPTHEFAESWEVAGQAYERLKSRLAP